ncbi:AMP-binding protein [Microbacterium sp.]|uniref:AMP-binding protein n=1 Tax=Microbacterium sp. TaxID=51671 RepID=UPI0033400A07
MSAVAANRVELTPLSFLARGAVAFPGRAAVRSGDDVRDYRAFAADAQSLARALSASVPSGRAVTTLSPNSAELLIAHFGVPLAGNPLVTVNTRLAAAEIAYILDHCDAPLLLADASLLPLAESAVALATHEVRIVAWGDPVPPGRISFDDFLTAGAGRPDLPWTIDDEQAVIAINYTSGTTGRPKGVEYTHRGAYLNALGFLHHGGFDGRTRYLWTLPMFHCNGWCAPWAVTAGGGLHLVIPAVREADIRRGIAELGATHLCGAPTVLDMVVAAHPEPFAQPITMIVGGAPPSPALLARIEALGASVTHVYGMTEVYGPFTICEYQPEWDALPAPERAARMSRQGVPMLQSGRVRVVDGAGSDVPADGTTIGEILMQGNNLMRGYHRDPDATAAALADGWLRSGDLGVVHPDGYLEVKDRAKDIIISGGENISSIEVENALLSHPAVSDAAVVGVPDARWGERPCAYVVAAPGCTPDELRAHLAARLARYKIPDALHFVDALPRTSTGKVLKRELRQQAENAARL